MKGHDASLLQSTTRRCGRLEFDKTSTFAPLLVSKKSAASALSVCLRTIDNLLATRQLPCRRIGRRTLIPYSALVAFARRDHIGTPDGNKKKATDSQSAAQGVHDDHTNLCG
jgi:hypothetical protein